MLWCAGEAQPLEYSRFPVPLPPGAVRLGVVFFQASCRPYLLSWLLMLLRHWRHAECGWLQTVRTGSIQTALPCH